MNPNGHNSKQEKQVVETSVEKDVLGLDKTSAHINTSKARPKNNFYGIGYCGARCHYLLAGHQVRKN